jgi:polar amino acid transport system substrate-binding protein
VSAQTKHLLAAHRWLDRRHLLRGLLLAGSAWTARTQAQAPAKAQWRVTVLLEEFPPYAMRGSEGKPEGYAVELAQELLRRAGVEAAFEFDSWPRIMQRAKEHPHMLIPAIVRLPEREEQFLWIAQTSWRRGMLYRLRGRRDVQVRELADARRYLTGVIKGDVAERELVALGLQPGQHLDASADYTVLLRKFFAGRVQLVALNSLLMAATLQRHGYPVEELEPVLPFSNSRPSMALSLGSDERLAQALRQAWESMRRDGSAAAIAARHGMLLP